MSFILYLIGIYLATRLNGWCVDENGNEMGYGNEMGAVKLTGSFSLSECIKECQKQNGVKVTGCEHNSVNGRCWYHTKPVSGGNGDGKYSCWTLNPGKST